MATDHISMRLWPKIFKKFSKWNIAKERFAEDRYTASDKQAQAILDTRMVRLTRIRTPENRCKECNGTSNMCQEK